MRRRGPSAYLLVLGVLLAGGYGAAADTLEPPPESADGADYEIDPADSLAAGSVEVGVGASGRAGERPRRTRRVRFEDGGLGGTFREGTSDPLSGGTIESRGGLGTCGVGKLSPRWGEGLVFGAAGDPWSLRALDRGPHAAWRGRAGQGAWLQGGETAGLDLLVGRFSRHDLAGARVRIADLSLGLLGGADHQAQASLAFSRGQAGSELALDRDGRWRAEGGLERPLGVWSFAGRVRGGLGGFRSLAEPQRSGPAQSLTAALSRDEDAVRVNAIGSLWRFRPGLSGARAALEVERRLAHHGALTVGFEEQHGVRREAALRPGGFRQGLMSEWRGGPPGLAVSLRYEVWGARRFAREAVRSLTAAGIEAHGPAGMSLRLSHTVYRVRRGESLYLTETSSDRLVLRAVAGAGARTRLEMRAPGGGGWISGGLNLSAPAAPSTSGLPRPQWTLNWTRRARTTARRAKDGEPP
jgi:hypothetical protein